MVTIEIYTTDNLSIYKEKYDEVEDFIRELAEMSAEFNYKTWVKVDISKGEGMFTMKDEYDNMITYGLIEEKKNKTRVTIDEFLESI